MKIHIFVLDMRRGRSMYLPKNGANTRIRPYAINVQARRPAAATLDQFLRFTYMLTHLYIVVSGFVPNLL
jgi:hypothetical protein